MTSNFQNWGKRPEEAVISDSLSDMPNLQEDFQCINCKQYYTTKWCNSDDKPCRICIAYLPMKDNYTSILKDIDCQYFKSGETSRREFYNDFLDNLEKWANYYHVFCTKQDLKTIEELRNIQDWTRQYWH